MSSRRNKLTLLVILCGFRFIVDNGRPPTVTWGMGDNTKMKYTQDKVDRICEMIIEGYTIRDICATDGLPSVSCLFKWLREHPEFEKQYARAKEEQAEIMVQEMLQIADDGRNDFEERENKDGSTYIALRSEHVQRSRLRVDTRKWAASKFKPKKYGDRMTLAGDPEAPLSGTEVTDNDREAMARFLKNNPEHVKEVLNETEKGEDHDDFC